MRRVLCKSIITMLKSILAFSRLSKGDRQVILRAMIRLIVVHVSLLLKGWPDAYATVQRRLEQTHRPLPPDNPKKRAEWIATLVDLVAVRVSFATCLRRSLVLW